MKLKLEIARCLAMLLPLLCGGGCATKALWNNGNLEAWNQPAANPSLRLFEAKPRGDLLVVYNEYSERHEASHTRAYWLNENEKLISGGHAPHFVSTNSAFCLTPVPVFSTPPTENYLPPTPYAVVATNGQSFTLFANAAQGNSHELPFYNDGKGKVEKFALTPLATTADLTIVGGFVGYLYLAARCGASGPWF